MSYYNELKPYIGNQIVKYARDEIQHQRHFRISIHDLKAALMCIEYEMQNVRGIDQSKERINTSNNREDILLNQLEEKENIQKYIDSFTRQVTRFDKLLDSLGETERRIIEYELERAVSSPLELSKDLDIQIDEVKRKEAAALLKIGNRLLHL